MTSSAITTAATIPRRLSDRERRYGPGAFAIGAIGRDDAGVTAAVRTAVASIARAAGDKGIAAGSAALSASRNSSADWNRAAGCFDSARVTTRSSGAASRTWADGTGGGAYKCAWMIFSVLLRG